MSWRSHTNLGASASSRNCRLLSLSARISSQSTSYGLSSRCSPITQTQTSPSAPSFQCTDFPWAARQRMDRLGSGRSHANLHGMNAPFTRGASCTPAWQSQSHRWPKRGRGNIWMAAHMLSIQMHSSSKTNIFHQRVLGGGGDSAGKRAPNEADEL